jgi:hypothetical protein
VPVSVPIVDHELINWTIVVVVVDWILNLDPVELHNWRHLIYVLHWKVIHHSLLLLIVVLVLVVEQVQLHLHYSVVLRPNV